jgi:hypothetical protein
MIQALADRRNILSLLKRDCRPGMAQRMKVKVPVTGPPEYFLDMPRNHRWSYERERLFVVGMLKEPYYIIAYVILYVLRLFPYPPALGIHEVHHAFYNIDVAALDIQYLIAATASIKVDADKPFNDLVFNILVHVIEQFVFVCYSEMLLETAIIDGYSFEASKRVLGDILSP